MASLYIKHRPSTFEELIGNNALIQSLEKYISKKNHPHTFLLSGPPGTGKTTIARIMANKLGSSDLDIKEINSANSRGIDTAREIIQQVRMAPLVSKAIVYILDEAHKWTNDFQNALLKPLEDTPEHVYFFVCTTDPQKLIKAIKSRCTEIKLSNYSEIEISQIIKRVLIKENVKLSKEIILKIAELSEGSPRKALVLLESVMSLESEDEMNKLLSSNIQEEDPEIIELARILINEKTTWKEVSILLKALKDNGKLDDSETVRYIIMGYMSSILLSGKLMKRAAIALEAFSEPTYNNGKNGIILACLNVIS